MLMAATLIAAVGWLVMMLVLGCLAKAKEVGEAREELNDRMRMLCDVAASVGRTSDKGARLVRHRSQPFRQILHNVPGVRGQPQHRGK